MSNRRRLKAERNRKHSGDSASDGSSKWTTVDSEHQAMITPWLAQCLDASGAGIATMGNEFGPAYPGDDRRTWVLCAGCAVPFEWWGETMLTTDNLETDPAALQAMKAFGPCPRCGGVGTAIGKLAVRKEPGRLAVATHPWVFEELLELVTEVGSGQVTPEEAASQLRSQGLPLLTRIAETIERWPASTGLAVGLLGIAVSIGIAVSSGQDEPTEDEVDRIVERVVREHQRADYVPTTPRATWLPQPRRPGSPPRPVD